MKIQITDHTDNKIIHVREKDCGRNYFKSMREVKEFLEKEDYKILEDWTNIETLKHIRVEKKSLEELKK